MVFDGDETSENSEASPDPLTQPPPFVGERIAIKIYISFFLPGQVPTPRNTPQLVRAGVAFPRRPAAEMGGDSGKPLRRYRPSGDLPLSGDPATRIGSSSLTPAIVFPSIRSMITSTVSGGTSTVEYLS